jgi:hypothetical protein
MRGVSGCRDFTSATVAWEPTVQAIAPSLAALAYLGLHGRMVASVAPGISADIVLASRAINGWSLDTGRLAAAVGHFAPRVQVDR